MIEADEEAPRLAKAIEHIPMPDRLRRRPITENGFPVPWFIAAPRDGKWDLRVVDPSRVMQAHNQKRCWVCGERLGAYLIFTIGPMCAINRVSAEPPSHQECAEYAVRACPFLSHPRAKRNEAGLPDERFVAGFSIPRNPGVTLLWTTRSYRLVRAHAGGQGVLFHIGDPLSTRWFCEGRPATRAEVDESVRTGLPSLEAIARQGGTAAVGALSRQIRAALPIFASAGAA